MSWTPGNSTTSNHLRGVAYGNLIFVAVGDSGTILTSLDGVAWTVPPDLQNPLPSVRLRGVTYCRDTFIAVGDSGTILTSLDGVNWTARTSWTSYNLEAAACDPNSSTSVVVGEYGTILLSGIIDSIAPITTALPPGGTYTSAQSVTLTCSDGSGSGCDKIYYTTDGTNPTTGSPVYSSPIGIATNTTIRFFAVDLAGNPEDAKMQIYIIVTSPLTITTLSLPSGTLGTIYNQTLSASGGAPPYTWSVSSGALPDGLSLSSSTGALLGTPTQTGTFNSTVRVTDIVPSIAIKNFSITIGMGSYSVRVIMPPRYFSTIQDAYDACNDGDTIEIKALDFFGDLFFDLPGSVILRGGCNADFTSNFSYTTIYGTVTISDGTVEVDHLIIK